jgi:hypothetical protein
LIIHKKVCNKELDLFATCGCIENSDEEDTFSQGVKLQSLENLLEISKKVPQRRANKKIALAKAYRLCKQNCALRIIMVYLFVIILIAKINEVYHLASVNVDH